MHHSTDALGLAYRHHRGYVRGCLRRAGVAGDVLDDAVHDVFAVLVRRQGDVDPRWSLRQYLAGIAKNVAANHRRRARRPDPGGLAAWGSAVTSPGFELRIDLVRELGSLEPTQRDAVLACDREGRSAAEIASAHGVPLTTVQWRLRCAHQRLRGLLERWRHAVVAALALDLRRLAGAWSVHGGIGAALAAAVLAAITLGGPTPVPITAVASPAAAPAPEHTDTVGRAAPPTLSLALALPPASRSLAPDGDVRLGVPRVESRTQAASPVHHTAEASAPVRPRAARRRPTARAAASLFPTDAIHFVMDDLHVPTRRRS